VRAFILSPSRRRILVVAAVIVVIIAGIAFVWRDVSFRPALVAIARWARHAGWTGCVLFAAGYLAAVIVGLPTSVLTALSGFLYGPLLGSAIVLPPSLLGAAASFAIARSGARRWIERRMRKHPRIAAVDTALHEHPITIMTLLRLSPVLPSNLMNFLFALTGVRFAPYILACVLSMIPGTLMFAYAGAAVTNVRRLTSAKEAPGATALYWFGLVAAAAGVLLLGALARRALARHRLPDRAGT
jgi:uncharacterized membrane protein YdjX (TVP38/TMEM64 family)